MDEKFRARRNELIRESFRDTADHDYIAARGCARLELLDQFLWSSLHALEKYLKAILLFHDGKALGIGHNLTTAIKRIKEHHITPFEIDSPTEEFLEYLTRYGQDRYRVRPSGTSGYELFKLDKAVWSIRRFCQDLQWLEQQNRKQYQAYLSALTEPYCKQNAIKFRLLTGQGYLEQVLDTKKHLAQREQLVWKNVYYGSRKKNIIKNFSLKTTGITPALFRYPDLHEWANKHIQLSKPENRAIEAYHKSTK
jgi:HEPN domain-containing protein